jgi:peptidyl-tRNA hydrolase, PTH1 family
MKNAIKLFVGLGNPGDQYITTRHNAGFWWVDLIANQTSSKLTLDSKMFGMVGKLNPHRDKWLLKPNTYMNASGKAVAALANYYHITPEEILVIHDELDLPAGQSKLKFGGGHGGHNGLRDIHAALGYSNYWRLRIGIGHPGDKHEVVNYVLKAPNKDEQNAIDESLMQSSQVLNEILSGAFEAAMLKLHTKK